MHRLAYKFSKISSADTPNFLAREATPLSVHSHHGIWSFTGCKRPQVTDFAP